jgi:hypothetical protein
MREITIEREHARQRASPRPKALGMPGAVAFSKRRDNVKRRFCEMPGSIHTSADTVDECPGNCPLGEDVRLEAAEIYRNGSSVRMAARHIR